MQKEEEQAQDYLSDPVYICKSSDLINKSLKQGHDIIQLPNGDILITEIKSVLVQYSWDKDRNKFHKHPTSSAKTRF